MFPYQINMNWENHMYVQKILNANMYLPRSCKCSIVTNGKYPLSFKVDQGENRQRDHGYHQTH